MKVNQFDDDRLTKWTNKQDNFFINAVRVLSTFILNNLSTFNDYTALT